MHLREKLFFLSFLPFNIVLYEQPCATIKAYFVILLQKNAQFAYENHQLQWTPNPLHKF